MMRSRIVFCLICLFSLPALAQQTISGKLLDSASRKPVPYATITILDKNKNVLANTFSNESGLFTIKSVDIKEGIVEITCVGFAIRIIPWNTSQYDLGEIHLAATSAGLGEVTVTGTKKLIDLRPGMLVYNAENDISNKGGTAADVLRKTPIINVDAQGNVTMRGSGNLKILINGKYSGQIARSPADALNMMSADNIRSVEVITTPSAKYDAEGAAGVINIITKKGYKNINGALELSAGNMEQMFNPRIAITNNKWSVSLHGHIHRLRFKEERILERQHYEDGDPSTKLEQHLKKDNAAPHGSFDLAVVYAPDSANEISFGTNAWIGKWPQNATIFSRLLLPNGTLNEQYNQSLENSTKFLGGDFNITYNRKFKKPGQEVTLLTQFSPSLDKAPYNIAISDISHNVYYREQNNNRTDNREWTVQLDYVHPLSPVVSIDAGGKMIHRSVSTKYDVVVDGQHIPARSDYFRYSQEVWAGYGMLKVNITKKLYAEAGLRFEETILSGNFRETGVKFDNRFSNFIPTATISNKIDEDQQVSLSYTQRITRPYIWDLNPNANAGDPKNIEVGNPGLQPEIAHQAELTYGLNKNSGFFLNTALFWKLTDDAIVDLTTTDATGISTTSKQNVAANTTYGLNFSSSFNLTPRWSMNGNININYLEYNSDALQINREGWAADIDLNTTVKLPRQYSVQVFADYNSRAVTLQGYRGYNYYYSFAGKKSFPQKKFTVTLALINPFNNYISQKNDLVSRNFNAMVDNRNFSRAVKLTLNWEFGSMFGERERKKINNNDIKGQPKG